MLLQGSGSSPVLSSLQQLPLFSFVPDAGSFLSAGSSGLFFILLVFLWFERRHHVTAVFIILADLVLAWYFLLSSFLTEGAKWPLVSIRLSGDS